MDDGSFPSKNPPPMFGNFEEFIDQLFDEGCWLQTVPPGSNISRAPNELQTSVAMNYTPPFKHSTDVMSVPYDPPTAEKRNWSQSNAPPVSVYRKGSEEDAVDDNPLFQNHQKAIQPKKNSSDSDQTHQFFWDSNDLNTVWIAPQANPGPMSSVKQRLMNAIWHFKDLSEDKDVLIQIWVPIKKGVKNFLTTAEQPYFHDPASTRLVNYRTISEKYNFLADEESKEALGLPGRVYLGKVPEWTPDVRLFGPNEYPRIDFARMYDVRGSIALPVFERGSANCLGVVELVATTQKVNYRPEVENVCRALEAVNLKSSDIHRHTTDKLSQVRSESYKAVIPEILKVLKIVSDKHDLPLAQTWAPCLQQGKHRCWNLNKISSCISTIDYACYVRNPQVSQFHDACSEHHLLDKQGIVGQAFVTNQPSFATDITAFSKSDYPLSHHGKIFGLQAAVAIRIRSVYNGEFTDFVLEFFLPTSSNDAGLAFHFKVIESLSVVIQQGCQNLRFISDEELRQKPMFPLKEMSFSTDSKLTEDDAKLGLGSMSTSSSTQEGRSWISDIVEAKRKGKEVAVSLGFSEEERKEGFKLTDWNNSDSEQLFPGFADMKHDYRVEDIIEGSAFGECLPGSRKHSEKRKTKAQKTISLQVLRQYFSGSLKDAARNIGVCPTTLKRICRQHGITRWPSRKIKKVGHSLKKLQMVIDSVQGAEGSLKLSSFYRNFPELGSPNLSCTNRLSAGANDQTEQQGALPNGNMFASGGTTSKSPSMSSSHTSSSSQSISTGVKISPAVTGGTASGSGADASTTENPAISLKRARSEAQIEAPDKKVSANKNLLERSQSNTSIADHLTLEIRPSVLRNSASFALRDGGPFKAKASFGEETIRFSILPNMGFADVRLEIAKRFNIDDLAKIQIKYLDDDQEWVLLTCDADLDECIDIQRSSGSRTAKLSIHHAHSSLGTSYGSSGKS